MTTPPEDHDVPWWRVVKADGSLLAEEDEDSREWILWARSALLAEGVDFTSDGRVASLAQTRRPGSSSGRRSPSAAGRPPEPEPCWKHDKAQYTCRDCAPGR